MKAAKRHQRFVVLIVPAEEESVEEVNEYAKIYYVKGITSPFFDKRYRLLMPWQYLFHDTPIREILLKEKPDLIEICDKYTLIYLASMIRKGKFLKLGRTMLLHLTTERMDDNIDSFITKSKFGKWFSDKMFDFHIGNSQYTVNEIFESVENNRKSSLFNVAWRFFSGSRISEKKRIFVSPCGCDFDYFAVNRKSEEARNEILQKVNLPENAKILLYAGRISPEKNIELLIEMMKFLSKNQKYDFRLLVAGDGPKKDWLKSQTETNFLDKIVQFGHLDKETLAKLYANADVFVHPNPREPFGIGPLEAMASGVPVVAPNSGGILSYATQENAWLCNPNGEEFATAITEIIENPSLVKNKTQKAIETAKNNTREKSTDSLLATYDKLYDYFQEQNEFFTDIEKAKVFDFSKPLESD
jgi:glycosyltransferase involved in cell wall biosynthesis